MASKRLFFIFLGIFAILLINSISATTDVNDCRPLNKSNEIYILQNDVVTATTCFNITANNITFDLNGSSITGDDDSSEYGIHSNGFHNATIMNGHIEDFGQGIFFENSQENNISNMTFNSCVICGIQVSSSNSNSITNNTITNSGNRGFMLVSSSYNVLSGNNFTSNNYYNFWITATTNEHFNNTIDSTNIVQGSGRIYYNYSLSNYVYDLNTAPDAGTLVCGNCDNITIRNLNLEHKNRYGIYFFNTHNSLIENVTTGDNGGAGIYFYQSINNTIENCSTIDDVNKGVYFDEKSISNTIKNLNSNNQLYGISIEDSSHNRVVDSAFSANTFDVDVRTGADNNTFLNCSYGTGSDEGVTASELIRKWYYRVYVNDTNGNGVSNVNITAFNVTDDYNFNLTTNASGWTEIIEIIEYFNDNNVKSYYNNYTIFASYVDFQPQNKSYNVTSDRNNLKFFFTLEDTVYPLFSNYSDNNGSLSGSGVAMFNVSVENTNGTVYLQINGTNYIATNLTASVYNVSVSLSNGTYNYSWGAYGNGVLTHLNTSRIISYTVNESIETPTPDTPLGGGGSGGSNCKCKINEACQNDYVCHNCTCVKLFDVKILDFNSPVKNKEFLEFIYLVKGVARINNDVVIEFWVENEGKKIASGQDTIYFGTDEEKTEESKLFIPTSDEGVYYFYIKASYGETQAIAYRTIYVEEIVKEPVAIPSETKTNWLNNLWNFLKKYWLWFIIGICLLLIMVLLIFILKLLLKKKEKNRLKSCIGLTVFSEEGIKIGEIKGVRLDKNKIGEWVIKPKRKLGKRIRRKKLLLKHKDVKAIGEIMIVDERIIEKLN